MSDRKKPVVIAGGGIGGLSTALALAVEGIPSHVCERRPAYPEEGAGIQLGPNATKLLKTTGVFDILRPTAGQPDRLVVHDGASGSVLTEMPLGGWMERRYGAPYLTVHRQDLHTSLRLAAESEPLIRLETNAEVVSFIDDSEGVFAILNSGQRLLGHAVIGADGLWSRLRRQVTDAEQLIPAHKCAYRGVVRCGDFPSNLSANDVHIWLHPGAHIVHYPVRAGREIALVAILDDPTRGDSWSLPAEIGWVEKRGAMFPESLRSLLSAVETWRMWSLQTMPKLQTWSKGRVALLGDAAHPIFPFLAQGGVLAIEDAAVLARCLTQQSETVAGQLAAYTRIRQGRVARVAEASRRNGEIYHMSGALAAARDAVLRSVPARILISRYDWLYRFEP